jgi:hypothetical protein
MSEPDLIPDGDIFRDDPSSPVRPLTEAERAELAEFQTRDRERQEHRDDIYRQLRNDAQTSARSMYFSPQLDSPEEWEATVSKALEDYRSGRALMDQLGADRLLDAPTAGMLLAIRRGLIEEANATSASELVLIDMAVIDFANAMRLQAVVGNTALIIESEMFGQPTLRARWQGGGKTSRGSPLRSTWGGSATSSCPLSRRVSVSLVNTSRRSAGCGRHLP